MGHQRHYDGVQRTTKEVKDLLPQVLGAIGKRHRDRPDLIMAAWSQVIGERLAPSTEVVSFREGILTVKVKNSTLYSLLSQYERPKLLKSLREKFPSVTINNLIFRVG